MDRIRVRRLFGIESLSSVWIPFDSARPPVSDRAGRGFGTSPYRASGRRPALLLRKAVGAVGSSASRGIGADSESRHRATPRGPPVRFTSFRWSQCDRRAAPGRSLPATPRDRSHGVRSPGSSGAGISSSAPDGAGPDSLDQGRRWIGACSGGRFQASGGAPAPCPDVWLRREDRGLTPPPARPVGTDFHFMVASRPMTDIKISYQVNHINSTLML